MKAEKIKKTLAIQKDASAQLHKIVGELKSSGVRASDAYEGDVISLLIQREDTLQFLQEHFKKSFF